MNKYYDYILNRTLNNSDYLEKLKDSSILITGATGLIGSYICRFLNFLNIKNNLNIKIYAAARNENAVKELNIESINYVKYDMNDDSISLDSKIDYVIHTASPTQSAYFVSNPVETINIAIKSLNTVLSFSKDKNVKGMVFLSSMEVYGICTKDIMLNENDYYPIDINNVRNSYSEGKRILECLACSYNKEYDVPVKIVRLCQTFGPGIKENDNRVFAQFAKKAANKEDIILNSKGDTKRSYCSIPDCINGIFYVLLNGQSGESYNLASDDSYIDILTLCKYFSEFSGVKHIIDIPKTNNNIYLPTIRFGLSTDKIKKLGYKSVMTVKESSELLYKSIIENK